MNEVLSSWLSHMKDRQIVFKAQNDSPNYWAAGPETLITSSSIHSLHFGTGASIYSNSILPALEAAEHEVILVTCFWARSPTLNSLNASLRNLASKARSLNRTITVRICLSSYSLVQKLFHPMSTKGKDYPRSTWKKTLGLPDPSELEGLDLRLKSIFILPFSVMHPKFVMIDRRVVFLPSCNVSWETWFEGCLELSGVVLEQFFRFYRAFWVDDDDVVVKQALPSPSGQRHWKDIRPQPTPRQPFTLLSHDLSAISTQEIQALFLPSPHHQNPLLTTAPPTPLNTFILQAVTNAKRDIYLQTPNLTSSPVLTALLSALQRGVTVSIVTSERLMVLEQLVTALTTTSRCVRKLIRSHQRLLTTSKSSRDLEAGVESKIGKLKVAFYTPSQAGKSQHGEQEPVQSHLKLTVVDGEVAVFGSGNMDRASWFTSQELGVAVFDREFAGNVMSMLEPVLEGRKKVICDQGG